MKQATAKLTSVSPYSQSRHYLDDVPELPKESKEDYEERTWMHRCHVIDGNVFIPPMSFKNALSEVAKYLAMRIPGKGKSTYTKHFEAGVLCIEPVILDVKHADVKGEWYFVPASGRRGDGKRVSKKFPVIPEWSAEVVFQILDETITEDVFYQHLEQAGKFIGIGRFRPRNNGFYGRFKIDSLKWEDVV